MWTFFDQTKKLQYCNSCLVPFLKCPGMMLDRTLIQPEFKFKMIQIVGYPISSAIRTS